MGSTQTSFFQIKIIDKTTKNKSYFAGGTMEQCRKIIDEYKVKNYIIEKVEPITFGDWKNLR